MNRLAVIIFLTTVFANANADPFADSGLLRTELDRDVAELVGEIQERMHVLQRIQMKIVEMDARIERLESSTVTERERIKKLRHSRIQLAELHGAMKVNAEQALAIVETYSQQLSELLDQTDS